MITTDSVGAFAELPLEPGTLLVWAPPSAPLALQQVVAALPPNVLWSHLTALDPAGVDRLQALAQRLGRPASWWLPRDLAPILSAYAQPLTKARPWGAEPDPQAIVSSL